MTTEQKKDFYKDFSKEAQEVAPKIEKLLNGLSLKEVKSLLFKVQRSIERQTKVTT